MDRKTMTDRVRKVRARLSTLNSTLLAMESADIRDKPETYTSLAIDVALQSEDVTCRLRHLLYGSTTVRKREYLNSAGMVQGIEILYRDSVLKITLPCLLPKRNQDSGEFLLDPLFYTMSRYEQLCHMPHFRSCAVCFEHNYDSSLPMRRIRDYDNLEQKQILDGIAAFCMEDDTAALCDVYHTVKLGDRDCTCIYVMEQTRFLSWLSDRQKGLFDRSDSGQNGRPDFGTDRILKNPL